MKVGIGEAAKKLGVSIPTLRRWESEGKIRAVRTAGNHRRYDLSSVQSDFTTPRTSSVRATVAYARVSSHDQKTDLERQVQRLESYCSAQGWTYEVLTDLGSGLNYNKKGLRKLIQRICDGEVSRLVLTHKDRLLRFGSELIFSICERYGTDLESG
jgi:excisionase family DNA binding protein